MKILIPPSEGKAKVKSTKTIFSSTNFRFEREVNQVVRLLELIDDEDLRSVYGTSAEKALMFHPENGGLYLQLAGIYESEGKISELIIALEKAETLYLKSNELDAAEKMRVD